MLKFLTQVGSIIILSKRVINFISVRLSRGFVVISSCKYFNQELQSTTTLIFASEMHSKSVKLMDASLVCLKLCKRHK